MHVLDKRYKNVARWLFKKLPILRPIHDRIIFEATSCACILDLGCGRGNFLKKALYYRKDLRLFGCDLVDILDDEVRNNVEFKACDLNIEKLPFDNSAFSIVICSHVIEHLSNPHFVFQEVIRVLTPSGLFILETPSLRSLFFPSILPNWFKDNPTINFYDDPTHIRPYTRTSLLRMAKQAGFSSYRAHKSRNILSMLSLPMIIYKILRKEGILLSGFVGTAFGTINLLIAKK
jgi:SAM-dependent methyltransferase